MLDNIQVQLFVGQSSTRMGQPALAWHHVSQGADGVYSRSRQAVRVPFSLQSRLRRNSYLFKTLYIMDWVQLDRTDPEQNDCWSLFLPSRVSFLVMPPTDSMLHSQGRSVPDSRYRRRTPKEPQVKVQLPNCLSWPVFQPVIWWFYTNQIS